MPLYDTEGGWLHLSIDELVAGALAVAAQGPAAASRSRSASRRPARTRERLAAVRDGHRTRRDLMVDANQSMTATEAIRRARRSSTDSTSAGSRSRCPPTTSKATCAWPARPPTPIAVGESMYSIAQFREYLDRGAAGIVQVDVARIGGITPWLKVAHLAEAFNVHVCPHFLMELHVSLVAAVPNGRYVEHIPQLRGITRTEMTIEDGRALAPETVGLGIDWDRDAIENRIVSMTTTPAHPPSAGPGCAEPAPRFEAALGPAPARLVVVIAASSRSSARCARRSSTATLVIAPMQADISIFTVVGLSQMVAVPSGT